MLRRLIPFAFVLVLAQIYSTPVIVFANLQTLVISTAGLNDEDNGSALTETYHSFEWDLKSRSDIIKANAMKSFCVVGPGLWVGRHVVEGTAFRYNTFIWNNGSQPKMCSSVSAQGNYFQLRQIFHGGHSNTQISGLSLFTREMFSAYDGGLELYFGGKSLSLPEPIAFQSFAYTGQQGQEWKVYEEPNFGGRAHCLLPENESGAGGIWAREIQFITIGSVRRGCEDSDSEISSFEPFLELGMLGGGAMLSTDGEVRLISPISVEWYTLNGNSNWTIFESIHGDADDGEGHCLEFIGSKMPRVEHPPLPFSVGSVRRGCADDPVEETTTAPMISTTAAAATSESDTSGPETSTADKPESSTHNQSPSGFYTQRMTFISSSGLLLLSLMFKL